MDELKQTNDKKEEGKDLKADVSQSTVQAELI
jgi:hypothetical protein